MFEGDSDRLIPTQQEVMPNHYEAHRAFVRRAHTRVERVYAYGGLSVLVAPGVILALAYVSGMLWTALPWVSSVMAALVLLYLTRRRVEQIIATSYEQVRSYCEANQIDAQGLRAYYAPDKTYRFFEVIFARHAAQHDPPDASNSPRA